MGWICIWILLLFAPLGPYSHITVLCSRCGYVANKIHHLPSPWLAQFLLIADFGNHLNTSSVRWATVLIQSLASSSHTDGATAKHGTQPTTKAMGSLRSKHSQQCA
jgi:hypothetical protein